MQLVKSPTDKCRGCKTCKEHEQTEIMSIKEEVEQDKSVSVDIKKRITTAVLPFMFNPLGK